MLARTCGPYKIGLADGKSAGFRAESQTITRQWQMSADIHTVVSQELLLHVLPENACLHSTLPAEVYTRWSSTIQEHHAW